jgi:hypothetical protein
LSGNKPCQLWTKAQRFGDHLCLHPLMTEAEMVSETLTIYPQLTRLVARENFIEFSRREIFKSYINVITFMKGLNSFEWGEYKHI